MFMYTYTRILVCVYMNICIPDRTSTWGRKRDHGMENEIWSARLLHYPQTTSVALRAVYVCMIMCDDIHTQPCTEICATWSLSFFFWYYRSLFVSFAAGEGLIDSLHLQFPTGPQRFFLRNETRWTTLI